LDLQCWYFSLKNSDQHTFPPSLRGSINSPETGNVTNTFGFASIVFRIFIISVVFQINISLIKLMVEILTYFLETSRSTRQNTKTPDFSQGYTFKNSYRQIQTKTKTNKSSVDQLYLHHAGTPSHFWKYMVHKFRS
jgi:hypothetical protein